MYHLKIISLFLVCTLFINNKVFSQENIQLKNPSFEAARGDHSTLPNSWDDCSDNFDDSPPDLHDRYSSFFNVLTRPVDGETFVGMVTRANGTYESLGQFLTSPLEQNKTYQLGIYIAQSKKYSSISKVTMREEEFNEPIVLRIWGGNYNGERGELLAETEPISHQAWMEYIFEFQPTADYKFLTLEAYYDKNLSFPYRGNILIDHCSDITLVDTKPLSEIEDFTILTNGKLLSLILECKEADANLTDGNVLDIIFDSWHFNNKLKEIGVEELVTLLKPDLLNHYLTIYEFLELDKPLQILEKTIEKSKQTEKKTSDLRFLRTCDDTYEEAIFKAGLREKHLTFIEENRTEVIILLEACQGE